MEKLHEMDDHPTFHISLSLIKNNNNKLKFKCHRSLKKIKTRSFNRENPDNLLLSMYGFSSFIQSASNVLPPLNNLMRKQ